MCRQKARYDCGSSQQPQEILNGQFDLVKVFKTEQNYYLTIGLQKRKGDERDPREEGYLGDH